MIWKIMCQILKALGCTVWLDSKRHKNKQTRITPHINNRFSRNDNNSIKYKRL